MVFGEVSKIAAAILTGMRLRGRLPAPASRENALAFVTTGIEIDYDIHLRRALSYGGNYTKYAAFSCNLSRVRPYTG